MRITFVQSADRFYADSQMFGVHFLPVWAYTLAAHCEEIPDLEFGLVDDRIQSLDDAPAADIFLYSGMNQDYTAIAANRRELARRFPQALHCIGGPICWSFQQAGKLDQLAAFDHIFIGDGEEALPAFLRGRIAGKPYPHVIETKERFAMANARRMHRGLLESTVRRYYGAVIEVSRGCPFLCEFCDIRVMPDNNRSHVKSPECILAEVDFFARNGVSQIILACDNFIGNSKWAEEVCDRIIEWRERTGLRPGFYTWLSVDVARHPNLLKKLKAAGIDMLFIGVESFHKNSLLETSKVQNTSIDLVTEIRRIQAHGLIVVAGLIFGFDTDPEDIVPITLEGIRGSGLISGDPSLLTALPGTPLYLRMRLSQRLRQGKVGLGGLKYQTNIKYLKPVSQIVRDFTEFVASFNTGSFQYSRLASLYSCLTEGGVAPAAPERRASQGFSSILSVVRMVTRNWRSTYLLVKRVVMLFASPERFAFILRAAWLTSRLSTRERPLWFYFRFWLFNWSNSVLKYSNLSAADFDIGSVDASFSYANLVPEGYETETHEEIPMHKIRMQRKNTAESLRRLVAERAAESSVAKVPEKVATPS